jgi:hypothetical protein
MSKMTKILGALALAAVAAVLGISSLAFIRPAEASSSSAVTTHGGRGMCGQAGLDAAAKALGMTTDELTTQLWAGETLSSLAEQKGVDLTTLQKAVNAACTQATRDAIEQAVKDGAMTREKADWLLEGLDKGFWGGEGDFGIGFGPRGFGGFEHGRGHGFPGFGAPGNNTATPTPTGGGA